MKTRACPPPWYYRLAIWVAAPLYYAYLFLKRHRLKFYKEQIKDRFAINLAPSFHQTVAHKGVIWCHAVSLGELNTAYPLLQLLLADDYVLYITSTTTTGYERAKVLFADEISQGRCVHGFVPIDKPSVIHRFLCAIQPKFAIFIETELWANTLYALKKADIACAMMNARLVQKSFERYQKFGKLSQSMMNNLSLVVAQDEQSCQHFLALGLDSSKLFQADSLKWASVPVMSAQVMAFAEQLRAQIGQRFVWTAGSTHEGEERICLEVHEHLMAQSDTKPLLIIVPRHPERFDEVYRLCQELGLSTCRESLGQKIDAQTEVYLADSMGRLMVYYEVCDVVFVGGSLIDKGGHTPIEPASRAKPVIMGHYLSNAQVLVDELKDKALIVVNDKAELMCALTELMIDTKKAHDMGQAAKHIVNQKRMAAYHQKAYLDRAFGEQGSLI